MRILQRQWGEGLTTEDMEKCRWLKPRLVATIEYLGMNRCESLAALDVRGANRKFSVWSLLESQFRNRFAFVRANAETSRWRRLARRGKRALAITAKNCAAPIGLCLQISLGRPRRGWGRDAIPFEPTARFHQIRR
jgi:hypothetical protein